MRFVFRSDIRSEEKALIAETVISIPLKREKMVKEI